MIRVARFLYWLIVLCWAFFFVFVFPDMIGGANTTSAIVSFISGALVVLIVARYGDKFFQILLNVSLWIYNKFNKK